MKKKSSSAGKKHRHPPPLLLNGGSLRDYKSNKVRSSVELEVNIVKFDSGKTIFFSVSYFDRIVLCKSTMYYVTSLIV